MPARQRRERQQRRARHHAQARRDEHRREEREVLGAALAEGVRRLQAIAAPDEPLDAAADDLQELFGGEVLPLPMARLVQAGGGIARARALADALLERQPDGLMELHFAADAAVAGGELEHAAELYERAAALADREDRSLLLYELALARNEAGQLGEALGAARRASHADPLEQSIHELYAELLRSAWERLHGPDSATWATRACPCGSKAAHGDCCGPKEVGELARFEDRTLTYALRSAVSDFAVAKDLGDHFAAALEHWTEELEVDDAGPPAGEIDEETASIAKVAIEHAWLLRPGFFEQAFDEDHEMRSEGEEATAERLNSVLGLFSREPGRPARLKEAATDWVSYCRYGLWQVADPKPGPGVWMQDLVSGRRVYASLPPEQLEALPRWCVLMGVLVPLEGTWRSGEAFRSVSPADGERLAGLAREMFEQLCRVLLGEQRSGGARKPRGRPSPVLEDELPPEESWDLVSKLVAQALPTLWGLQRAKDREGLRLTNTDGHPLVQIDARVRVENSSKAWRGLERLSDFESSDGPEGSGRLLWRGRAMSAAEAATARERMAVALAAEGRSLEDFESPGPQRFIRGFLQRDAATIEVNVNSEERFELLLEILRSLGGEVAIESVERSDIANLLPDRPGLRLAALGVPSEAAGLVWAESWLSEKVPALGDRTPRAAARSREGRTKLEALLREFEHDADLARLAGKTPVDVGWLRRELGMQLESSS